MTVPSQWGNPYLLGIYNTEKSVESHKNDITFSGSYVYMIVHVYIHVGTVEKTGMSDQCKCG